MACRLMGLTGQRRRAACQQNLAMISTKVTSRVLTAMPGCSCSSFTSFPLDEPIAQSPELDRFAAWDLDLASAKGAGTAFP